MVFQHFCSILMIMSSKFAYSLDFLCNNIWKPTQTELITFFFISLHRHLTSQEMIEGGITSRMSGIIENAGHHPSPQDYRWEISFNHRGDTVARCSGSKYHVLFLLLPVKDTHCQIWDASIDKRHISINESLQGVFSNGHGTNCLTPHCPVQR